MRGGLGGDDLVPKKKLDDSELDITPMIDVTFLLLIFFMVASTMKPSGEEELARAKNSDDVTPESMMQVSVLAPTSEGGTPTIKIDGREVTLAELTAAVRERGPGTGFQVLLRVDQAVPNGYLGEVYSACREVEGVKFHHAVEEKK